MVVSDFVVSFRFSCDDFFIRHETNVCAENKKSAIQTLKKFLPMIEDVRAEHGIVMLYGNPYTTIKTDVPRQNQITMFDIRRANRLKQKGNRR